MSACHWVQPILIFSLRLLYEVEVQSKRFKTKNGLGLSIGCEKKIFVLALTKKA